ncbi:MAG: cobyric acid synthase [Nitrospirae bacterium]|nr:cobyric acid synthase [Nitrospirota bacterium]
MAKALMIQGTGSGAGKSLVAAAFCRIFSDMGIKVAPFKAQNMALNSSITAEGGEIGRAQALQARAARVDTLNDMNPVLLKVSGNGGSQVIIHGRVHAVMKAREYYAFRDQAWKAVTASYARLAEQHDLIVLEGAGSPAEINLLDVDIVNMAMAKHAKAPVLLVADIDKGGVFASLYGTVKLLGRDSRHIKAFIINKFRGDKTILDPGLDMIRKKAGRPVIGVLPYVTDLGLPEEDGLALARSAECGVRSTEGKAVKIVIVRLKYISNFTDFDPLALEPDTEVVYSDSSSEIESADLVILPGSKNTVIDLLLLKEKGLVESIRRAYDRGTEVIGICGGYQMLGRRIDDPSEAESNHRSIEGIGLLNIETTFGKDKVTSRAEAEIVGSTEFGVRSAEWNDKEILKGYEIHMGASSGDIGLFKVRRTDVDSALGTPNSEFVLDGSMNKNCWGTYLHGIFDNDLFRRDIIDHIRKKKGLPPGESGVQFQQYQEKALDRLAAIVREHVDMEFVRGMLKL